MKETKASELEVITTREGYALARHNGGHLGIWAIYTTKEVWDGSEFVPCQPVEMALELEGDCGGLMDFEHFEEHVYNLKAEAKRLAQINA